MYKVGIDNDLVHYRPQFRYLLDQRTSTDVLSKDLNIAAIIGHILIGQIIITLYIEDIYLNIFIFIGNSSENNLSN